MLLPPRLLLVGCAVWGIQMISAPPSASARVGFERIVSPSQASRPDMHFDNAQQPGTVTTVSIDPVRVIARDLSGARPVSQIAGVTPHDYSQRSRLATLLILLAAVLGVGLELFVSNALRPVGRGRFRR